jgi:tyrosyl-tRNA synthetase
MTGRRAEGAGEAAEEAAWLAHGAVDCLPQGALARKCAQAREQHRPLRVKLGIDPTAPDIHLGHAVLLRKLRAFQDAGHRIVLIVGDFTARVGDPSGRSELRPLLSPAQIEANAATFKAQALRVITEEPASLEVRRNSEWLQMGTDELLGLLKTTTVAQLIEREDFAQRLAAGRPISMLEMVYPLLQGYDSVAVRADVELGGTDQKFNLLLGRDVQRAFGQDEQAIITMPILRGTDGERKMSKSLRNDIGVAEEADQMYGKLMSIPDRLMGDYYRLLLGHEPPSELSPRDAKRRLARELVAWLHSQQAAEDAQAAFDRVFIAHKLPEEIPELALPEELRGDSIHLPALIAAAFGVSRSEARRLLGAGAVRLDGSPLGESDQDLPASRLHGEVLQIGRRRYVRIRAS